MQTFKLKLTLTEPMLGTVPKDKEVYKTYIATKKKEIEGVELTQEELKDEVESIDEVEQKGWTGFHSDENGLYIYDYMVRGFLKNAGNILKNDVGVKNLSSKISQFVFVGPRKIYLGKKEPDGVLERPLRAQTAQGPRVTLARSDIVNAGTELNCELVIVGGKEVTEELLLKLLDYGKFQGLGQFRSGSYGRFTYVVE